MTILRRASSLWLPLALLAVGGLQAQAQTANRIAGYFEVAPADPADTGNPLAGEAAAIYLVDGRKLELDLGGRWFKIRRSSLTSKIFRGREADVAGGAAGAAGALNGLSGTSNLADGGRIRLRVTPDPTAYEGKLTEDDGTEVEFVLKRIILATPDDPDAYDKGPKAPFRSHLRNAPAYPTTGDYEGVFWDDWGSVFYRGRLDGSSKIWCIASDPGPTECLPFVRRSLVGDAGQRVQGFLKKLGLTRSYTLVNAFTYATRPSKVSQGRKLFRDFPEQLDWRNEFYDMIYDENLDLEAIVLFGTQAEKAFNMWNRSRKERNLGDVKDQVFVIKAYHPSYPRGAWNSEQNLKLAENWRAAIDELRAVVTPDDADLAASTPNYRMVFSEADYARIPPADLPKEARDDYPWLGDNTYSRNRRVGQGRGNNPVSRIGRISLELKMPAGDKLYFTVTGRDPNRPNDTPDYETSTTKPTPVND